MDKKFGKHWTKGLQRVISHMVFPRSHRELHKILRYVFLHELCVRSFVIIFRRVRKIAKSDYHLCHVCHLSVCTEHLGCH